MPSTSTASVHGLRLSPSLSRTTAKDSTSHLAKRQMLSGAGQGARIERKMVGALKVSTLDAPQTEEVVEHVMWFDKHPELWQTAESERELVEIFEREKEKMIFIDFYAGFCGSCKAAFPSLCRIAGNPDFQKDFLFVKCCVLSDGIKDYVKANGITGIPTVLVCAPGGRPLADFKASFRQMNAVKANLVVMAANKGADFVIDPNGFVIPRPE